MEEGILNVPKELVSIYKYMRNWWESGEIFYLISLYHWNGS